MKYQRGIKVKVCSFFNVGVRWEWAVNATPRPICPRVGDQILIEKEVVRVRKFCPSPGFDPRTVQSVASRYTNCGTRVQEK